MKTQSKTIAILIALIATICVAQTPHTQRTTHATEPRPTYALILQNCVFKRTLTGNDVTAIYCVLPQTYFVQIINPPLTEPEPTQLLQAKYQNLIGYVQADTVEIVTYLPVTAYPTTGTATVDNDGLGLNMRETPTKNGTILAPIQEGTTLTLIGQIEGEERKSGQGTLWHFVQFGDDYGYVYNADVTITATEPNIISAQPEPEPPTNPEPEPTLKPAVETILILALVLPTILIVTLLFHRPNKSSKYQPKQ